MEILSITGVLNIYKIMHYNDLDPAGQMSQEASIAIALFIMLGYCSEAVPILQATSYFIGIIIGLGTLMLNWDKYWKKLLEIIKSIKDAFQKTK